MHEIISDYHHACYSYILNERRKAQYFTTSDNHTATGSLVIQADRRDIIHVKHNQVINKDSNIQIVLLHKRLG